MNFKIALSALVAAGFIGAGCSTHHHEHITTKLSQKDAAKIAESQVPGGKAKAKDTHLEKVDGRYMWATDVSTPNSPNMTQVHVDANTGEVVHKDMVAK